MTTRPRLLLLIVLTSGSLVFCSSTKGGPMPAVLSVTSTAFLGHAAIPSRFTCDGADVSPPLRWNGVPDNAVSIVLICDDPDAPVGTWVHWVCYNIPPSIDSMPEAVPKSDSLPTGGLQGVNDFRTTGYGGPCPPGGTHRYFFRLHALDIMLTLPAGASRKAVERAMKGHVRAAGELIGTYSRAHR